MHLFRKVKHIRTHIFSSSQKTYYRIKFSETIDAYRILLLTLFCLLWNQAEMRVRNVWIRRKDIKIPETTDLVEFYDNGNNNSVLYNRKQSADRERNTVFIPLSTTIKLPSFSSNNVIMDIPSKCAFHAFTSTNYVYFFPNIWKIFLLILHITTPPLWFSPMVYSWGFQIKKKTLESLI